MPNAASKRAATEPPPRTSPPGDAPSPTSKEADPKPDGNGGLFRALLQAGCDPVVAYTAEQQAYSMTSEIVAAQMQPVIAEMKLVFQRHDQQFTNLGRKMDALTTVVAAHGEKLEKLAERDRKLDVVLAARMDSLKVQVQMVLGALGVLVTVLIAVFGFLFAN